ncbi:endolytic transglycosylase MltG [Companilactobacillus sp. RD055328]|uniref:endolytic transglycosylase MltG n=1 Tax=Companilactobacillus sp. RD055328 TaxID=2916634 RepID=UPI0035D01301
MLRNDEKKVANKIILWIVGVIAFLALIVGIFTYHYVHTSLQPLDKNDKTEVVVNVPIGSSTKEIAAILQKEKVIKSATVFNYFVKTHSYTDFQAGYYNFQPSMTLEHIVSLLQKGGTSEPQGTAIAKVLVKEGVTVEQVGDAIAKKTKFSKKDFLSLMKDKTYMKELETKYPELLKSSLASEDVRYNLEGYLFPATYNVVKGMTLKQLVTSMVEKANSEYAPYFSTIKEKGLTVQQAITLASLIEREGVTEKDRKKISGVFFNRIDANMPLQSDISVMYALNKHKHSLTNKDTSVDSPYNLYINAGYGPGPFNNPSISSLQAVVNPTDSNYLYFVANLKTGKVYYSKTYDQHLSKNASLGQ